jgi:hypothetical protein
MKLPKAAPGFNGEPLPLFAWAASQPRIHRPWQVHIIARRAAVPLAVATIIAETIAPEVFG